MIAAAAPGQWLEFVIDILSGLKSLAVQGYGFDLTPEMVELARIRLSGRSTCSSADLRQGDILGDSAYIFDNGPPTFDLVIAYDVIQQLPRELQTEACRATLRHLAPGGIAIVFDHERASFYGVMMGAKKLATRYLSIPLVPAFYCNARYPMLRS